MARMFGAPRFRAERFKYGEVPLGAKKADLMFLQHMVAVLRDGGLLATVMPHGVLFRGGEERAIRKAMIEADLLEAVIGLPAGLFYGTGIPACVLVMRQRQGNHSGKPAARQGKVLFINADREYFEGRAQNHLLPEHIEKVVNTFENFAEVPGFSAIVSNATLAENDHNLNIRRYADNAPPPSRTTCAPTCWAACPRPRYRPRPRCSWRTAWTRWRCSCSAIATISTSAPSCPPDRPLGPPWKATPDWWRASRPCVRLLTPGGGPTAHASARWAGAPSFVGLRNELLHSFSAALEPAGVLGRFQVRGIVAGFWDDAKYEFMTLMARGAKAWSMPGAPAS